MAESYNTLAGLVQWNDKNNADFDVSDLFDSSPFLAQVYTQIASNGTLHKYLKQDGASSAAFRDIKDGITKTVSTDTQITVTLEILAASFNADMALARGYKGGVDAYLQKEFVRAMRQAFFTAEKQVWYGTGSDAKGFAGIVDSTGWDALADTMVTNAGGATADEQTSCFLLRQAEDGASFILGNDGELIVEENPTIQETAGSATGTYPAYYVPVEGWAGWQVGSSYDIGRIANIDTSTLTSTDAFTDDKIAANIAKFKAAMRPNICVMNRDAQQLLRNSRTAVNPTGAPAPFPESVFGIPIVVVDSIVSTEAVEV